ncbi:hypothetical protein BV22DRAFT_1090912 [Leucogyrophana mollusca]|uniref:Uncharacterized protein n=1 Tax=Leucogyrophana mollusca TaxID=85980 RepID=A0ACB8BGF8_9AGAM|nr:hypothetical protein BV22DRAFT_1090912 [Leucogyrophana mollusca]
MAPVTFTGTLRSKRRAELLEIAKALQINESGTKEDLQTRIKKHLDANQTDLEDEPAFAGLFAKMKKSSAQSQPQPAVRRFVPPAGTETVEETAPVNTAGSSPVKNTRSSRRITLLDPVGPIRQGTPVSDLRDVSIMLKNPPISPEGDEEAAGIQSSSILRKQELAHSPAKTGSTPRSPLKVTLKPAIDVSNIFRGQSDTAVRQATESLLDVRTFLSSSLNIWSLTAVLELSYIIYAVTPWKYAEIPLSPTQSTGYFVPYPPLSAFQNPAIWSVIFNWSIPTLVIPALFGVVLSFHPANMTSARAGRPTSPPLVPFDPLTASIIRLAAQFIYSFDSPGTDSIDVVGQRWRIVNAAVGVAFAFVEAIFGAPGAFANANTSTSSNAAGVQQPDHPARSLTAEDTVVAIRDA